MLRFTPDLDRRVLEVRVRVSGPVSDTLRLAVRLTLGDEVLADDTYPATAAVVQRDIPLDGARIQHERRRYLWSPDYPNLLDAEVRLLRAEADGTGGTTVDTVRSYCGLRSVRAADRHFVLNGRGYPLRMVLAQNYWPASHLAAPDPDALRREVELVKELGFNGVRIHQKVEDPRFLAWCDRLGVLAWGEMPSALDFDPRTVRRLIREWLEVLERDVSSPALVAWVPFNESWGVPNLEHDEAQRHAVRALYHLTKSIDPTRPVIGNDGWEHLASDIWGVHDYALDGATIRERYGTAEAVERTLREIQPHYRSIALPDAHRRGEPVMLTECGGITDAPAPGEQWWGYSQASGPEALQARYGELIGAILDCPAIVGFCYTQLTDTEQERNGLLTAERAPKADPAAIRAITTGPARALPAEVIANIQAASEVTAFGGGGGSTSGG